LLELNCNQLALGETFGVCLQCVYLWVSVAHIMQDWSEPFNDVHTFAQVKNPTVLEAFEKHNGYFMADELDSSARAQKVVSIYSTMLFARINEHRFWPGIVARRLGGFEWRWWLVVDSDLVREYRAYLDRFDAHDAATKAALAAVDGARERWFEREIDNKFKCSLAYRRGVV
jgi:hypothetical protein